MTKTLLLDCGSGGRASQRLINELFLEQFDNPILRTTHARSFIFHPDFKGLPDTIKKVMKFLCDL